MKSFLCFCVCSIAGLAAFVVRSDIRAGPNNEKHTTPSDKVAQQFMKALSQKDIGALMKTVDVPFSFNGRSLLTHRDQLKASLKQLISLDSQPFKYRVRASVEFQSLPASCFTGGDHERFTKIVGKTGRLVVFEIPHRYIVLAIRSRAERSAVVGFRIGSIPHPG